MKATARHWPLAAAWAVLYAAVGACLLVSLHRNEGHFVYALDDAYIHMAVAKNLAEHGTFGITRYGFSSSTSSIVWPLLLGLVYLVLGTNALAPLAVNLLCATGAVFLFYCVFHGRRLPPWLNFVYLVIVVFGTPLPAIIFTGMEHTLHVLLAVAFLCLAAKFLSEEPGEGGNGSRGPLRAVYFALAPLLAMTRYEAAFMIAVVCLLSAVRRRIRDAAVLATLGAAPVVLSGMVSVRNGWHFFPNPLLLKGRVSSAASLEELVASLASQLPASILPPVIAAVAVAALIALIFGRRIGRQTPEGGGGGTQISLSMVLVGVGGVASLVGVRVLRLPSATVRWLYVHDTYLVPAGLLAILLVLFLVYRRDGRRRTADKAMLWIFLGTALLHLALARTGWFYRYEAYLVACGLLVVFTGTYDGLAKSLRLVTADRQVAWCSAVAVLLVPLAARSVLSLTQIPTASANIYQQQYQMASFLKEFYMGQGVAANDVGAINFYADVRNLDLWGLGSLDVVDARLQHRYGPEAIRSLAVQAGIRIAVVYDGWFQQYGGLPPQWQKVGEWEILNNVICAGRVVSFYAVAPDEAGALKENLVKYSSQLPEEVIQRGAYLEPE